MKKVQIFLGLMLFFQIAFGQSYNSHVINISAGESANIILTEKATQLLLVSKSFGLKQFATVKSYKITTGKIHGDKEIEGDMRTPEGIYYVSYDIPGEKLLPKYGPLAMVLDYPNAVDAINKKNGTNIWIHGRDVEIKDLQTEGCISLDNENTMELATFIDYRKTPIIIVDTLRYYDDVKLGKEKRYWESKIEIWRKYWETGKLDRYIKLYSDYFESQDGKNKNEFKVYKQGLEEKYKWIQISISDIIVYRTDEEVHVHFTQKYESPVFTGTGHKILKYFRNKEVDGEWRIIREIYNDTKPRSYADSDLKLFLRRWKRAWENKEIDKYEKFYSPNFYNGQHNFIQYLDYKKNLFAAKDKLKITVSDIHVENKGDARWQITFKQKYQSGDYEDYGKKVLSIKEINKVYFIVNESWRRL